MTDTSSRSALLPAGEQPSSVGKAADHSVQNDDVGRLQVVGELCDVEDPAIAAVPHAGAIEQLAASGS